MDSRSQRTLILVILSFGLSVSWSRDAWTQSEKPKAQVHESAGQKFRLENLTQQSDVIWGFDFLPDGRIVFTERAGSLKILNPKDNSVTSIKGAPKVWANGQGGLLDVRVHPTKGSTLYLTYSEPLKGGATTALAMATLSGNELRDLKTLFSAHEPNSNRIHFGSRIEFDGKGHIFVSIGDRNDRPKVQDLSFHIGKVIRLKEDGTVPSDNPFVKQKGAKPEIWSLGHRSPQGLARHPETGDLWLSEMGPRGGDEINLIKRGANYGWPIVTYGREYYGPKIGKGTSQPGMEDPVAHWVPSISPSGTAFYNGDRFPAWKGNLFLGNLSGTHLRRLVLSGQKVKDQEVLLEDLGMRIRNVRAGPDGYLYLSTDDGKIARLVPAQ